MSTLLKEFDFVKPASLDQLHDLVRTYQMDGRRFMFSAGGTNVIPLMKTQLFALDHLISLTGLPEMRGVTKSGHRLIIGGLTSLGVLARDDLIRLYLPALAEAAHKVGSPQIRNRATIAGNLMVDNRCIYINQSSINRESHSPCFKADGDVCHLVKSAKRGDETLCQARFVSDTAPVLLLLEADVHVIGPEGPRQLPLRDLYRNDGIDSKNLDPGEVITTIEVDIPENSGLHYEKLAIRNALDFPSLGVAVRLTTLGKACDLDVALTGLNTHPGLFHAASGDHADFEAMVEDVCARASDFAVTYQQDFFPRAYRKSMITVFIRRGIASIKEKANA